jgi:hypothetical protein
VIATSYELATEIILGKVQKDKSRGWNTGTAELNEDWAAAEASVDIEKLD